MSLHLILAFALSALQVADAVTTMLFLRSGAVEKNPIIRHLMDQIGVVPALALKVVLVSAVAIAAATYYPTAQPTHSDLARDFGRMKGRMDSFDKALAEGFSRIENALTKIDGRMDRRAVLKLLF
jgi:hypothetical protein